MSTEVAMQAQSEDNNNNNGVVNDTNDSNYNNDNNTNTEQPQSSLDTPSRESNANNNNATNVTTNENNGVDSSTLIGGDIDTEKAIDKIEETKIAKYSNLKSADNPLTIAREKTNKEGRPLMVNFDERVVVHTVPYWDPCGETFYDNDDEDGPRGPNCCIIL
mmetsp:Transcript_70588/g.63389  ORF Transcript_70588/g.63389 Transcript_70588/m.63389 type:complete len:162 (+) Transcript_70588:189-674(+)|eukprot:CAMPEP_0201596120 /NCGR_PEP_ID=MMETSP0190_2-20130828/192903_1 /ASSEMBLY_ACC=CAM_ASM_000263 /TAXON_ID=37353 /ORGANISM="Rosalina sp." /LENGTH=161 /DNA_ID=CAMNT_0048056345 /DNA_START=182 /DNA_END=670 /DNA_ORIENTATION=-